MGSGSNCWERALNCISSCVAAWVSCSYTVLIRGIFRRARVSRIIAVYTADIRELAQVRVLVLVLYNSTRRSAVSMVAGVWVSTLNLLRTCARFAACSACGPTVLVAIRYSTHTALLYTVPIVTPLVLVRPQAPPPYSPIIRHVYFTGPVYSVYAHVYTGIYAVYSNPGRSEGDALR